MVRYSRYTLTAIMVMVSVALTEAAEKQTVDDRLIQMDAQIQLLQKEAQLNSLLMQSVDSDLLQIPTIVSIMTVDDKRFTRLLMPNGTVATFTEGDTINKGMRIAAITRTNVLVAIEGSHKKRGDKVRTIALDYAAPAKNQEGNIQAGVMNTAGGGMQAPVSGPPSGSTMVPNTPYANPSLLREFLPMPPAVD